jgi:hypothetical protein
LDISRLDVDAGDQEQQQQQQGRRGRGGFQNQRNQWRKLKRKLRRNVELDDRMSEDEEKGVKCSKLLFFILTSPFMFFKDIWYDPCHDSYLRRTHWKFARNERKIVGWDLDEWLERFVGVPKVAGSSTELASSQLFVLT